MSADTIQTIVEKTLNLLEHEYDIDGIEDLGRPTVEEIANRIQHEEEGAGSVARDDARRARAVEVARNTYGSDDVEVAEDQTVVSVDGGYWVHARVWVEADAVELAAVERPPMMLDSLASFARTALTDPSAVGLRPFDLNRIDTNADAYIAVAYALGKLDEIIEALSPVEETRETMTDTLSVLGRHLAERADEMEARDAEEPDRTAYSAAASNVRAALDLVDVAIGLLLTPDESVA